MLNLRDNLISKEFPTCVMNSLDRLEYLDLSSNLLQSFDFEDDVQSPLLVLPEDITTWLQEHDNTILNLTNNNLQGFVNKNLSLSRLLLDGNPLWCSSETEFHSIDFCSCQGLTKVSPDYLSNDSLSTAISCKVVTLAMLI